MVQTQVLTIIGFLPYYFISCFSILKCLSKHWRICNKPLYPHNNISSLTDQNIARSYARPLS